MSWPSSHTYSVVVTASISGLAILSVLRLNRKRKDQNHVAEEASDELNIEGNEKAQREVAKKMKLVSRESLNKESQTKKASSSVWSPGAIPPGNFKTPNWLQTDLSAPIKDAAYSLEEEKYRLVVRAGDRQVILTLEELQSLGVKQYDRVDWHCVTGWSYTGLTLFGVPIKRLLSVLGEDLGGDSWTCLYQVCADGYTCPVYREDVLQDNTFLALRDASGNLLSYEHGGPRLVFPALWGWKSAKYMTEIQLLDEFKQGFWEKLMCHDRGRIFDENGRYLQERWHPTASKSGFHDFMTGMVNLYHHIFGAKVYGFTMYLGGILVRMITRPLLRFEHMKKD